MSIYKADGLFLGGGVQNVHLSIYKSDGLFGGGGCKMSIYQYIKSDGLFGGGCKMSIDNNIYPQI
jgi:hypothetical protein